MTQYNTRPMGTTLLTFLAGAAVGAVVVALVTPKSGPELRVDLKDFTIRARRRAGDMANEAYSALEEMKGRTVLAGGDLKRGMSEAMRDMKS